MASSSNMEPQLEQSNIQHFFVREKKSNASNFQWPCILMSFLKHAVTQPQNTVLLPRSQKWHQSTFSNFIFLLLFSNWLPSSFARLNSANQTISMPRTHEWQWQLSSGFS